MRKISTEVLVIGGGATGTGVVRDLALRGFKTCLVERRDLTHGTTGRYHGLLHSGGRYVVKDPQAARECIKENHILRKIMPHCLEDTGGYFVLTPWDDPAYVSRFLAGCREAGIHVEELSIPQMLREEPALNPDIVRCFRVPDASADSFLAADANAESARQHGASIYTYYEVRNLICTHQKVTGAVCYDLISDEQVEFSVDLVVNAAGAWAGKIAAYAGLIVQIKPGKGTMVAINHRVVNTVINRCKIPADGDIIVPAHTVAVIGTTDEQVVDPDHFAIEPWEIQLMLDEGEKLIPNFKGLRMLRAWAGVRPLFTETVADASRDITRAYVLLDHAKRDGIDGLVTITSGKWTTYRKMAEVTVDKVCEKLGVQRLCRTHLEMLPTVGAHGEGYHYLGARLAKIESHKDYGKLICECELATYDDVERAIRAGANTIDDIRRDTRLGMGPCQGGFCTIRATGLLYELRPAEKSEAAAIEASNNALRDYLQERWKGLLPVLWGQQLRQERLDELIYLNVLAIDRLPGEVNSRLGPQDYASSAQKPSEHVGHRTFQPSPSAETKQNIIQTAPEVLVIGAGLAGLTAAWQAARRGKKTRLISKGWGALYWNSGCIDVLGDLNSASQRPIVNLRAALEELIRSQPSHPYALTGLACLEKALLEFQALCNEAGYPFLSADQGDILGKNWLLPTVTGTLRSTCLVPKTMVAGACSPPGLTQNPTSEYDPSKMPILLVGFKGYYDFSPKFAAANLNLQGITTEAVMLDVPALTETKFLTSQGLARALETQEIRDAVICSLQPVISAHHNNIRIGFPAVLGYSLMVWMDLQERLDCPVFELPGLPPSIPGIRLHQLLMQAIEGQGGGTFNGMQVQGCSEENGRIIAVLSEAAVRMKANYAQQFILATGGFLGGGFSASPEGIVIENVFDLPLVLPARNEEWFNRQFLARDGHPLFSSGVLVNASMQPVSSDGDVIYSNLYAAGGLLAGVDPLREHSLEGIALVSALRAVQALTGEHDPRVSTGEHGE